MGKSGGGMRGRGRKVVEIEGRHRLALAPPRVSSALVCSNDGKREAESPRQIPFGWDLRDEKGQEAFFAASGSSLMSPDVLPNFRAGSTSHSPIQERKIVITILVGYSQETLNFKADS